MWRYVAAEVGGNMWICGRGRSALEAKPQCGPLYIRSPHIKRFKGCSHMTLK